MKCEDVQGKLPEYLGGTLDKDTKVEIDAHIRTCDICNKEMVELNKGITFDFEKVPNINQKKILKKTKFKFNLAIVRTVIIILGAIFLISIIPTMLWGIQSALGQDKASRALMDIVQFSQPNKVNMWGNSAVQGFSLSVPLKIGARPVIGRKYREQLEFVGKMSVLTGKVSVPVSIGANFVHPKLFKGEDFGRDYNIIAQTDILKKNADNSVATVDYSLNKTISLSDVDSLINKFDVEICWMAVESGIEDIKPKNMTFEKQQVLQWGIPSKLSNPGKFDFAQLKKDNAKEFEKLVIKELKWLNDNKEILKPDSYLLKDNGIDNSVSDKASYILKNGINIYGLRITGPSSELIKLSSELDARTMSVVDIDFWNW
jgi:hypothetical protein